MKWQYMLETEGDSDTDNDLKQSLDEDYNELTRQGPGHAPNEDGPDEDVEDAMPEAFVEATRQEPRMPSLEPLRSPSNPDWLRQQGPRRGCSHAKSSVWRFGTRPSRT